MATPEVLGRRTRTGGKQAARAAAAPREGEGPSAIGKSSASLHRHVGSLLSRHIQSLDEEDVLDANGDVVPKEEGMQCSRCGAKTREKCDGGCGGCVPVCGWCKKAGKTCRFCNNLDGEVDQEGATGPGDDGDQSGEEEDRELLSDDGLEESDSWRSALCEAKVIGTILLVLVAVALFVFLLLFYSEDSEDEGGMDSAAAGDLDRPAPTSTVTPSHAGASASAARGLLYSLAAASAKCKPNQLQVPSAVGCQAAAAALGFKWGGRTETYSHVAGCHESQDVITFNAAQAAPATSRVDRAVCKSSQQGRRLRHHAPEAPAAADEAPGPLQA